MSSNLTRIRYRQLPDPLRFRHETPVLLTRDYEHGRIGREEFWRQLRLMWGNRDVNKMLWETKRW